jgi:uncharacterized damage-inducible protein DinB
MMNLCRMQQTMRPPWHKSARATADTNILANIELLQRLSLTIGSLTNTQYTWQLNESSSSTGKHIRHIIDHYTCFFSSLERACINYDNRARADIVETKTHRAQEELSKVILQLGKLDPRQTNTLRVYLSATPDKEPEPADSSLPRELLFLQSHTIHHMAVIQLILDSLGVSVDSGFALAPSTIKYHHKAGLK